MDIRPNHTLYVRNLNDKLKKDLLKKNLYYLFSQFGEIVQIIACKTKRMRGQAFIVFKDINSSIMALRCMQSFPFDGKEMRIEYARKDTDVISKLKSRQHDKQKKVKRASINTNGVGGEGGNAKKSKPTPPAEKAETVDEKNNGDADDLELPPNKILFASNLPEETTELMLSMLFNQFTGFKEVRLVPNRNDIAFVEFETEAQTAIAKASLHGFKITSSHAMKISYARK